MHLAAGQRPAPHLASAHLAYTYNPTNRFWKPLREAALILTALKSISLFRTTTDNDDDIAATLTAQGTPISAQ